MVIEDPPSAWGKLVLAQNDIKEFSNSHRKMDRYTWRRYLRLRKEEVEAAELWKASCDLYCISKRMVDEDLAVEVLVLNQSVEHSIGPKKVFGEELERYRIEWEEQNTHASSSPH